MGGPKLLGANPGKEFIKFATYGAKVNRRRGALAHDTWPTCNAPAMGFDKNIFDCRRNSESTIILQNCGGVKVERYFDIGRFTCRCGNDIIIHAIEYVK